MSCEMQVGPALLARLLGNGMNSGRRGASPEGACQVECCCGAILNPKVLPGAASGDQAELPGPRDGLGPVGGAELAQDVADVLLDRVERHDQVVGDALV